MEELEDEPLVIELVEGGDRGVAERAVRLFDEGTEILVGDLVRGDVEAEDGAGEIDEGVVLPRFLPFRRKGGDGFGDVQAAVRGEACEDCLGEMSAR